MAGIELLSYGLGPSAVRLRAGALTSLINIGTAIWSKGLLCLAAVGGLHAS